MPPNSASGSTGIAGQARTIGDLARSFEALPLHVSAGFRKGAQTVCIDKWSNILHQQSVPRTVVVMAMRRMRILGFHIDIFFLGPAFLAWFNGPPEFTGHIVISQVFNKTKGARSTQICCQVNRSLGTCVLLLDPGSCIQGAQRLLSRASWSAIVFVMI